MARFVSMYGGYSHGVQSEVSENFALGSRVMVRGLEAQFAPGGLTEDEIKFALTVLHLHGLPQDVDTGAEISGRSRLSLFDTEAYAKANKLTDKEHDLVVSTLRESHKNGIDYVELLPQPAVLPWNGYDKLDDAAKIVELAVETETSLETVLAYERENKNRKKVVAALEQEIESQGAVEKPVVINAGS